MGKNKEVKKHTYKKHIEIWKKMQEGGEYFIEVELLNGKVEAEKLAKIADGVLARYIVKAIPYLRG